MPSPIKLFTPSQAAAELGLGRTKLLALVRSGRIKAVSLDGRHRIPIEALEAFRASLPGYTPGKQPAASDAA